MILIEELNTEFGNIKIMCSKSDGTYSYYQEECFHSQINAKGVSTCWYVHVMYGIISKSLAKNVLMIGCAGGTLATMLYHLGCKVTVVDINPHAFALAKKYFRMPEEIECVAEDGWSYLLKSGRRYDAIAIDAFNADATIPKQFTTEIFFQVVREVLNPLGVVVMNAMIDHDLDMLADNIALNMESARIPVVLFDRPGKRDRNIIIAGGAADHMKIDPGIKPEWVQHELRSIIRRSAKK